MNKRRHSQNSRKLELGLHSRAKSEKRYDAIDEIP